MLSQSFRAHTMLVQLLILAIFVDIGGKFGVKYFVFSVAIFASILTLVKGLQYKNILIDIGFALLIILYAVLGLVLGAKISSVYSQVGFILYFLLLPVLIKSDIKAVVLFFERMSFYAAIIVILVFIGLYLFPELSQAFNKFGIKYGLGYLGLKADLNNIPNVYFRWTAWLVLGFAIALYSGHRFKSLIIFSASILSLSTAVIAVTFFIYFLYLKSLGKVFSYRSIGVILIALVAIYFYPLLFESLLSKFSTESFSTSVKVGHIVSAVKEWLSSASSFLFGSGVGMEFFTIGTYSKTVAIEPSYANLLRQFGIIGAFVFLLYILYTLFSIWTVDDLSRGFRAGIVGVIFIGATNPIFFSVLLFFPLLIFKSYLIQIKR